MRRQSSSRGALFGCNELLRHGAPCSYQKLHSYSTYYMGTLYIQEEKHRAILGVRAYHEFVPHRRQQSATGDGDGALPSHQSPSWHPTLRSSRSTSTCICRLAVNAIIARPRARLYISTWEECLQLPNNLRLRRLRRKRKVLQQQQKKRNCWLH